MLLRIFVCVLIVGPCLGLDFSVSSLWDTVQEVSSSAIDVSKNLIQATADSIQNVNYSKMYNDAHDSVGSTDTIWISINHTNCKCDIDRQTKKSNI